MQALGLLGLMFGVVLIVALSTLSGYLLSAAFVVTSGALAVADEVLLRGHYQGATASNNRGVAYLIVGTALIFSGVD